MKVWFHKNYKTIIILAFLIPIITVAVVSISHVTQWYGISNPFTWAIYLSVGIEIAALSALAAISANMGKKIYFPFGIVTLIQFIGNIFFAYSFIDVTASSFKSWVELVSPLLEITGVEPTDFIGHKRFLAFFSGGMLPLISLSFLHMLVKFSEEERQVESVVDKKEEEEPVKIDASDLIGEISRVRLSEEDLSLLEKHLLNPPKPNEELIKAKEEYEKLQMASLKDEVTLSDEEIVKRAQEIELKRIQERMKRIQEIQNELRGYEDESEDPVGALANSEYRLSVEDDEENIEPSTTPQNASEMMLTTNSDIIESIPSDDEISDWDITMMDGIKEEEENLNTVTPNEVDLSNYSDEYLTQAIEEFNEIERLESEEESLHDDTWDVGIDPIDKDDEPIYQTDSKELDKMLDIVDEVIDEKKNNRTIRRNNRRPPGGNVKFSRL